MSTESELFGQLWAELCPYKNSFAQVLTPKTSEYSNI